MASIPPSESAPGSHPDPGTPRSDPDTERNPRPGRGGYFAAIPSSHLLVVEDELHNLASALAWVPELWMFAAVMDDIVNPPPDEALDRSHDRIGALMRTLPKDRAAVVDEALSATSGDAHDSPAMPFGEAERMDLHSTIDAIIAAARFRVKRLAVLMSVL